MPTTGEAQQLRRSLAADAIDASVVERAGHPYLAVWSDRCDVTDLVQAGCPTAVVVNLQHVPLPRRGEGLFSS